MTEGPGVFTTPETASASSPRTRSPVPGSPRGEGHEHGPVRPAAPFGKRPLTPLSRSPLPLHAHAPSCVQTTSAFPSRERGAWVGRGRRSPRPPTPPVREDRRLLMTRGAFHRQGPFVGSGGHYSPGPATSALASRRARRPLDDALTSPWAFSRSRSVISEAIRGAIRRFDRPRIPDV